MPYLYHNIKLNSLFTFLGHTLITVNRLYILQFGDDYRSLCADLYLLCDSRIL